MSRNYELTFIVKPDLDAANSASLLEKVKDLLTSEGGEIVRLDQWGMRRLMYPIRKFREGQYVFIVVKLEAATVARIEARLRLFEDIIRYLFIRADDEVALPVAEAVETEEASAEVAVEGELPAAESTTETAA